MIFAIAAFELRQRLRRVSFAAYYLTFAAISYFLFIAAAGALPGVSVAFGSGGKVVTNSPFALHSYQLLLSVFSLQLTAAVMGQVVHQDFQHQLDALFFTAPVHKRDYLLGRYLGGAAYLSLLFTSCALGAWVGSLMPFLEPSLVGENRAAAYLLPLLTAVLPNQLAIGAIFFAIAALTRRMRAVYALSVVMLAAYLIATSVTVNPENRLLAGLLDPFGLLATDALTQYWSLADKNTRLVGLSGALLYNRLLWLTLGAGVFFAAERRFQRGHLASRPPAAAEVDDGPRGALPSAPVEERSPWRLLPRLTRLALRETVKNVYFVITAASGVAFLAIAAKDLDSMFGTATYPVTYQVLELAGGTFGLFMIIILVIFAGELVWREREAGLDQLCDTLPLPTALPMLAKLLALFGALALLTALIALTALGIQVAQGYWNIEPSLYLIQLFVLNLPGFLILGVLAVFLHTLVNDKTVGHGLMILYFVGNLLAARFGFDQHLYRVGAAPRAVYSDMNGYGHFLRPALLYQLYWACFAGLLAVATALLWVRGKEEGRRFRLRLARQRLTRGSVGLAAALTLAWGLLGAFLYYNTNVLNRHQNDFDLRRARADYERQYRSWAARAQPKVTGIDVSYDLHPQERRLAVKATYQLMNKSGEAIDRVLVNLHPDVRVEELAVSRQEAARSDPALAVHALTLSPPLAPGDSAELRFAGSFSSPGFRDGDSDDRLAENGTFVDTDHLPRLGYEVSRELTDDDERRKEGLAPKERMADLHDEAARRFNYVAPHADWIRLRSTITTDADQIALAPGSKVEERQEQGRRRFVYQTTAPIFGFFSMLSARYAVRTDRWRDVAIELYYHPGHEYNLERMIEGVKDTLQYLDATLGPYPHQVIRIVEFPRYERFAQSFPTTIPYSESVGFIAKVDPDDPEDVDYPYYVTAHEVAHQWWANQVVGGDVQGATVLSETLSQYSALMVMKRRFGAEQMKRFLRFELDRYLRGRGAERKKELPLLRVENQPYVHYQKGSLASYALQEAIGEDTMNAALRAFFQAHRYEEPPYATSEQLLSELRRVTPEQHQALLRDLFETITLYELKAARATARPLPDGRFALTVAVEGKKLVADELGKEAEVPLDEVLDLGALDAEGKLVLLEKRRVVSGPQTLTATVATLPERAGIDPQFLRIDRDPEDNTAKVEIESDGAVRAASDSALAPGVLAHGTVWAP